MSAKRTFFTSTFLTFTLLSSLCLQGRANPISNGEMGPNPPVNDEPCGAIELTCGNSPITANWDGATTSPEIADDFCNNDPSGPTPGGDVWFKFTADGNSTYSYTISDDVARVFAVYRDDGDGCGGLQLINQCTTWPWGWGGGVYFAGTYYISVRPYDDNYVPGDTFQIDFTCEANPPLLTGCTDPEAYNYRPQAITDDGSCYYTPVNDEPCGALTLPCNGGTVSGSFYNATSTVIDPCFGNSIGDVWLTFEADGNTVYDVVQQTLTASVMSLFTADSCTGELTELTDCSQTARHIAIAPDEGTYYVRLRRWETYYPANYYVALVCTPKPNNTTPCAAEPISCDMSSVRGSNVGSGIFGKCGEPADDSPGVWYVYTADFDGRMRLNACQDDTNIPVENTIDNAISVFTGNCDDLECYAFNGYNPDNFSCQFRADLTLTVFSGQTYYFLVSGSHADDLGTFSMEITCTPLDCPGLGNIGGPCDDGDLFTENDVITANCECVGTPVPCAGPLDQVSGMEATYVGNGIYATWDPVAGSTACLHRLIRASDGVVVGQKVQSRNEPSHLYVPVSVTPGTTYDWGIRCGCSADPAMAGPWNWLEFTIPAGPELTTSPNPVSQQAKVRFSVANPENALLEVYDLNGRNLATLYAGRALPEGDYSFDYDASALPQGVYLYKLTTDSGVTVSKFMVRR